MAELLDKEDIIRIFEIISRIMDEHKDELCRLDAALGDGDAGLTASRGFKAVVDNFPNLREEDIGGLLIQSSLVMGEAVASTMGTLLATALMRGGKAVHGKRELSGEDIIRMFEAMVQGIADRGKARVGDKTILDSLAPATEAMAAARQRGAGLDQMLKEAAEAAKQGAERTASMQSRHGRASRYLERSIGHQDPGATVGALIVQGFADYVNKTSSAQ